ncbi:MAG: PD-(D/E)XK nuclease family transposase, partial [Bacilli bacterium]
MDPIVKSSRLNISNKKQKKGETDILIEVNGTIINLEMNKDYYKGILDKNNFYHNKILGEIYNSKDNYLEEIKVIQINFDNYTISKKNNIVNKYMIMNTETNEVETDNYEKYHIDLVKLKEECYNKNNKGLTPLEKGCLILIEESEAKLEEFAKGNNMMEETVRKIKNLSDDDFIIGLYDKEEIDKKVMRTKLKWMEQEGMKNGLEKGMKKGMKQGVEQGIKQGVEQGIKQGVE